LKAEIEDAYHNSGNTMGWRLLASPEITINNAEVAFIGLNPGGSAVVAEQSVYAMPEGQSAYVNESWAGRAPGQSPLQCQVRALFTRLNVAPNTVLAGNLVPFRSPNWASLNDPKGSLTFGKKLWGRILRRARPSIVITMGGDTTKAVASILGVPNMTRYSIGWGNITAQRGEFDGGTLIGLPHLSRFCVMNRAASADYLDLLFEGLR
jgi:uracil-DNA glycosylase